MMIFFAAACFFLYREKSEVSTRTQWFAAGGMGLLGLFLFVFCARMLSQFDNRETIKAAQDKITIANESVNKTLNALYNSYKNALDDKIQLYQNYQNTINSNMNSLENLQNQPEYKEALISDQNNPEFMKNYQDTKKVVDFSEDLLELKSGFNEATKTAIIKRLFDILQIIQQATDRSNTLRSILLIPYWIIKMVNNNLYFNSILNNLDFAILKENWQNLNTTMPVILYNLDTLKMKIFFDPVDKSTNCQILLNENSAINIYNSLIRIGNNNLVIYSLGASSALTLFGSVNPSTGNTQATPRRNVYYTLKNQVLYILNEAKIGDELSNRIQTEKTLNTHEITILKLDLTTGKQTVIGVSFLCMLPYNIKIINIDGGKSQCRGFIYNAANTWDNDKLLTNFAFNNALFTFTVNQWYDSMFTIDSWHFTPQYITQNSNIFNYYEIHIEQFQMKIRANSIPINGKYYFSSSGPYGSLILCLNTTNNSITTKNKYSFNGEMLNLPSAPQDAWLLM
jgi:hypothetical protein